MKRLIKSIFVISVVLGGLRYILLPVVAAEVARMVFELGTGSRLKYSSATLHFFPLSARIKDINLYDPKTEGIYHGVRIGEYYIELDFSHIYERTILLKHMDLSGVNVASLGTNSSFIRLLQFLFPPHSKQQVKSNSAWSNYWDSWEINSGRVQIGSGAADHSNLMIEIEGFRFSWADVSVVFERAAPLGPSIFRIAGDADLFSVAGIAKENGSHPTVVLSPVLNELRLGTLAMRGQLTKKVFNFSTIDIDNSRLSSSIPGQNGKVVSAAGIIELGENDRYALNYEAAVPGRLFEKIVPVGWWGSIISNLFVAGKGAVEGRLIAPHLKMAGRLGEESPYYFHLWNSCFGKELNYDLDLTLNNAVLELAAPVSSQLNAKFLFDFKEAIPISMSVGSQLGADFFSNPACFPPSIHEYVDISQAEARLTLDGNLRDLSLGGSFRGALQSQSVSKTVATSRLNSTLKLAHLLQFDWKADRDFIEISLIAGTRPQEKELLSAISDKDLSSVLFLDSSWNWAKRELFMSRLEAVDYNPSTLLLHGVSILGPEFSSWGDNVFSSKSRLNLLAKDLSFNSSWIPQSGSAQGSISAIKLLETKDTELQFSVNSSPSGVALDRFDLVFGGGSVSGHGNFEYHGNSAAKLSIKSITMGDVLPKLEDGFSQLKIFGELELQGAVLSPKLNVSIGASLPMNEKGKAFPGGIRGNESKAAEIAELASARCQGDYQDLDCHVSAFQNKVVSSMKVSPRSKVLSLDAQFNSMPIDFIWDSRFFSGFYTVSDLPHTSNVSGRASYRGSFTDMRSSQAQAVITDLQIDRSGVEVKNDGDIKLNYERGAVEFADVSLLTQGVKVQVIGGVDFQKGWDARMRGAVLLDRNIIKLPFVDDYRANASGELAVRGEFYAPHIDGYLRLRQGELYFGQMRNSNLPGGLGFEDIDLDAELKGDTIKVGHMRARLGSGEITGGIEVSRLFNDQDREISATVDLNNISFSPDENSDVSLDGNLAYTEPVSSNQTGASGSRGQIAGEIRINNAQYKNSLLVGKTLKWLYAAISNPSGWANEGVDLSLFAVKRGNTVPERSNKSIDLNLKVLSAGPLVVDTPLLQAEFSGRLGISGTTVQPVMDGEVEVVSGTFGFQAKQFSIVDGRIVFTSSSDYRNPQLDVLAEAKLNRSATDREIVQLLLRGNMQSPRVNLTSSSGLSPREILGLLGIGGGNERLTVVREGTSKRSVQELLNPLSGATIEERVAGITGFSEVTLDRSPATAGGKPQPRVIARRPFLGKSEVVVDSSLVDSRENRARTEYPIRPNLSIVAEWRQKSLRDPNAGKSSIGAGFEYERSCSSSSLFWCED